MKVPPRGISPVLLLSQVKNTMPYLFRESASAETAVFDSFVPAQILRHFHSRAEEPLSHFEYFRLCVSSHYLTCGTPVPTDVDNQIRQKLWSELLSTEEVLAMANLVLESHDYDFTVVTTRFTTGAIRSDFEKEILSGHLGEWFTLACGAYCALGRLEASEARLKREELFEAIRAEIHRHAEIFGSLTKSNDGLRALKASASIAHNLGDLDRVMDQWELAPGDPLRLQFYKLGSSPFDFSGKLRYLGRLWLAAELYKAHIQGSSIAAENHRHFPLRKPKCLRDSPQYLVPSGPFFDEWGTEVARRLAPEEAREVLETLKTGWERLRGTVGYGRAIHAFLGVYPDLTSEIDLSHLRKNPLYARVLDTSKAGFEAAWSKEALEQLDEIPSRAST